MIFKYRLNLYFNFHNFTQYLLFLTAAFFIFFVICPFYINSERIHFLNEEFEVDIKVLDPQKSQFISEIAVYKASCPVTVKFSGRIFSKQGGKIQYHFMRSDGATAPELSIELSPGESKIVETSWTIGKDYEGWMALEIIHPVNLKSSKANFKVECIKIASPKLSVSKKLKESVLTKSEEIPKQEEKRPVVKAIPEKSEEEEPGPSSSLSRSPFKFYVAGDKNGFIDIFDQTGSKIRSFHGNFTQRDGFDVGDINGDGTDEIVIAGDVSGHVDIFTLDGEKSHSFDGDFTKNDGFGVGDLNGDGMDEIVIAGDVSGRVDIFNQTGEKIRAFNAYFTEDDGFGLGDVDNDGKDEILILGDKGGRVDIFNFMGGKIFSFPTEFKIDSKAEVPYISIGAGDVNGDGKCEIVVGFGVGEKYSQKYFGYGNQVSIYRLSGERIERWPGFTQRDKLRVGDVDGDGVADIAIAGDAHKTIEIYDFHGNLVMSFIGDYTKNDGFALGKH